METTVDQVKSLTIADEVNNALVAKGITDEVIAELNKKADEHDREIVDADQYKEVEEARKAIKRVRIIGENNTEGIVSRYRKLWQEALAMEKTIVSRLRLPEARLKARQDAWEVKLEEEREAREAARMAEVRRREDILISGGFRRDGDDWALGETRIDAGQLISGNAEWFTTIEMQISVIAAEAAAKEAELAAVKAVQEAAAKAEAERIENEKAELARQRAEIAAAQAQLLEAQAKADAIAKERALAADRERAALVSGRRACLASVGYIRVDPGTHLEEMQMKMGDGQVARVTLEQLERESDTFIEAMIQAGVDELARRQEEDRVRQEKDRAERAAIVAKLAAEEAELREKERAAMELDKELLNSVRVSITAAFDHATQASGAANSSAGKTRLTAAASRLMAIAQDLVV